MKKNTDFYLKNNKLHSLVQALFVCMTAALVAPAAFAEDTDEPSNAAEKKEVVIVINNCQQEVAVPASKQDVRIILPKHTGRKCQDSAAEDSEHNNGKEPWHAVGADSCLAPFASQLERLDCQSWQLRQRYSEATARYKARINQTFRNKHWED
ncbi:MAG: hypothetical protein L3J26_09930 [Candidatus Polarisedimenticolaceae bacterium]|nr:hypothetical protein [Candidatus Polarisedimenticolaceae bacterium]